MFLAHDVQLITRIFQTTCEAQDSSCGAYVLGEYVIRSILMLGIIVAMNFNITVCKHVNTCVPPPFSLLVDVSPFGSD